MNATSVRGIVARDVATPETLDEAGSVLAAAAARGDAVAFVGGGTELGFGYAPKRVDLLLGTERLARIVEYAPADLVVEVEAGITLAALQEALAPHGQRLALDVPQPDRATIGGAVATNNFGPRRTRFGSLRDSIVGISMIRADGERIRAGGKVVKNVAGFDVAKLAVGSLGTLGMIATATFRLHPLPESARASRIDGCDAAAIRRIAREVVARQLEPAALLATRESDTYTCYALFEGFGRGVEEQARRFDALARDLGTAATALDDPNEPVARDASIRTRGDVRVRIAIPPAALEDAHRDAFVIFAGGLTDAHSVVYPSLGIAFVSGTLVDLDRAVRAFGAGRTAAEALGGNAVLLEAGDPAFGERFDVFGTLPPSFPLMRRLKDRFDPAHRFNAGRFLGGL